MEPLKLMNKIPSKLEGFLDKLSYIKTQMYEMDVWIQEELSFIKVEGLAPNAETEKYSKELLLQEAEQKFILQIDVIMAVHENLVQTINLWKFEQRHSVNCNIITISLESLQECCEELTIILWTTLTQIKKVESVENYEPSSLPNYRDECESQQRRMSTLKNQVTSLLSSLLVSSFLVIQQPPQILKSHSKFPTSVTVRHLSGHKLNAQKYFPHVTVRLIKETLARKLDKNATTEGVRIASRPSQLEYNPESKIFSAIFESHQMRVPSCFDNIRKIPSKSIWKEKFCLYFETSLSISDVTFKVWTTSCPSVVINNVSQHARATAFMFWDYKFGEILNDRFTVPNQVPWDSLAKAISQKFESKTGRGLNEEQTKELKTKLLGKAASSDVVNLTDFCKTKLLNTEFTFWNWCYESMLLVNKCFRELWCDGYILGIIDKNAVEKMLVGYSAGTFIVRFSDSILGAVSISWLHSDGKVYHVYPIQKNQLYVESLANMIMRLEKLVSLYPNIPKADVFGKYCKSPSPAPFIVNRSEFVRISIPQVMIGRTRSRKHEIGRC